jgi:hypothetical protein
MLVSKRVFDKFAINNQETSPHIIININQFVIIKIYHKEQLKSFKPSCPWHICMNFYCPQKIHVVGYITCSKFA